MRISTFLNETSSPVVRHSLKLSLNLQITCRFSVQESAMSFLLKCLVRNIPVTPQRSFHVAFYDWNVAMWSKCALAICRNLFKIICWYSCKLQFCDTISNPVIWLFSHTITVASVIRISTRNRCKVVFKNLTHHVAFFSHGQSQTRPLFHQILACVALVRDLLDFPLETWDKDNLCKGTSQTSIF